MRFSSSFKVGLLTIVALIILLLTIFWVKGRSFSSAERITINFKDVNGMRPGSGVQMMGLRVGQVEEITPVVDGDSSYVKLKFVITEDGVVIPKASTISIQQSGLIGEQFLEITPPRLRTIYLPMSRRGMLYKNDPIQMKLDEKYYDVGIVKDSSVISSQLLPFAVRENIKTNYAYKVDYIVNMSGLILPEFLKGRFIIDNNGIKKLRISPLDDSALPYPEQSSPYTIIEPMRIADFMDWQYKAAESLTETNQKINDLLSDDVIISLKQSVDNINRLTAKATSTMGKAELLIDSSRDDIENMLVLMNRVSDSFIEVSKNVNGIIGDKSFKPTMMSAVQSFDKLSHNLNKVLDKTDSEKMAQDIQITTKNLSEISTYVNGLTKDKKLKKDISSTITKINTAMQDVSDALEIINGMPESDKKQVESMIQNAAVASENMRKFSEKLNKRFLLFRLMF